MQKNKVKKIHRVAAIHDLSGYGSCSLKTAIATISAAGHEVCPIPAGFFNVHTALEGWCYMDTQKIFDSTINYLYKNKIKLDAIYSGFLSNPKQVESILKMYSKNNTALKVVDPAMAEEGKLYKSYTQFLAKKMKQLVEQADIITPNISEACILTNTKYKRNFSENMIEKILNNLHKIGAKNIILTGIKINKNNIYNYVFQNQKITRIENKYSPHCFHGAGDLFSSVIVSKILDGHTLIESTNYAGKFLEKSIDLTLKQSGFKSRGISYEPLLRLLY